MEISFKITKKDLFAFNIYDYFHSWKILVSSSVLFLLVTICALYSAITTEGDLFVKVILFLILEITPFIIGITGSLIFLTLSIMARNDKTSLTNFKVQITKDYLIEESTYNLNQYKWAGIHKIKQNKSHYFIYVSENTAVLIPKRSFENKESELEFYRQITTRTNLATANQSLLP